MDKVAKLSIATMDSEGNVPELWWIGLVLQHQGNMKHYTITGYCWNGADDTWMFMAQESDMDGVLVANAVQIVRPIRHIKGVRADGKPRYMVQP